MEGQERKRKQYNGNRNPDSDEQHKQCANNYYRHGELLYWICFDNIDHPHMLCCRADDQSDAKHGRRSAIGKLGKWCECRLRKNG